MEVANLWAAHSIPMMLMFRAFALGINIWLMEVANLWAAHIIPMVLMLK
jgi:hypothetical protein